MDPRTLAFALLAAATGVGILMGALAVLRGRRAAKLAFFGFLIAAAGSFFHWMAFVMPSRAAIGPNAVLLVRILSDGAIASAHLVLVWTLRSYAKRIKPWPARFWAYAIAWVLIEGIAVFAPGFAPVRTFAASFAAIASAIEAMTAIRARRASLTRSIRRASYAVGAAYAASIACMTALVAAASFGAAVPPGLVASGSGSLAIFFLVVWAGVFFSADAYSIYGDLLKRNAALNEMAGRDKLTGLWNRRHMDFAMKMETDRAERYGHALSLIIFDLDLFKNVNDLWGHVTGDEVLKRTAEIAKASIRESDGIFRWGGEEFAVLSPETPLPGARSLAEKIRSALESANFSQAGRMTASFGVAEWLAGEGTDDWFERADSALYRAKRSGRNKVVCSEGSGLFPLVSLRLGWKDEWASGNPAIDAEHKKLIALAGDLINASLALAGPEELVSGLNALLAETQSHFKHEEEILAGLGYPGLGAHARLHAALLSQAAEFKERGVGKDRTPGLFFDFLVDKVVLGHMLKEDALFFRYTREKTVKA